MSGRKHHYLPQLIQRPFAYRQQGKQFYVHAHHRTRGRFTPNTSGLGKELDFYGGPEDTSLDEAITRGEDALAETVQAINRGDAVAPADMATLVCALAFRTKSMREAFVEMLPPIVEGLRTTLLNPLNVRRELMASLTDPKEQKRLIHEQIEKTFGRLPRERRAKIYGTILPRWRTYVAEQEVQLVAQAWGMAYGVMSKLRDEASTVAHGAFLKALARDPAMPARANQLASKMEFTCLIASHGEFFILGDCGPFAIFTDGRPRLVTSSFTDGAEIEKVFLPVSPSRCIVGSVPHSSPLPGVMDINRFSASLSLEFFVSDRDTDQVLDSLRSSIGSLVPIDTEDDIIQSMSRCLK